MSHSAAEVQPRSVLSGCVPSGRSLHSEGPKGRGQCRAEAGPRQPFRETLGPGGGLFLPVTQIGSGSTCYPGPHFLGKESFCSKSEFLAPTVWLSPGFLMSHLVPPGPEHQVQGVTHSPQPDPAAQGPGRWRAGGRQTQTGLGCSQELSGPQDPLGSLLCHRVSLALQSPQCLPASQAT